MSRSAVLRPREVHRMVSRPRQEHDYQYGGARSTQERDVRLQVASQFRPEARGRMTTKRDTCQDSDDGFQDFLSEDEEQETLLNQESMAMERRMRTVGIRDGLELGKEGTLQEGFDLGFVQGATRSFRFGRLRGALGTAAACGLFDETMMTQAQNCISQLRTLEMDISTNETSKDVIELAVHDAKQLLMSIGIDLAANSQ